MQQKAARAGPAAMRAPGPGCSRSAASAWRNDVSTIPTPPLTLCHACTEMYADRKSWVRPVYHHVFASEEVLHKGHMLLRHSAAHPEPATAARNVLCCSGCLFTPPHAACTERCLERSDRSTLICFNQAWHGRWAESGRDHKRGRDA